MLKHLRLNNQIKAAEVKVIDDAGTQLGVMAVSQALKLAYDRELDLVEVGPEAQPPIAKIMDYGKYMYQKSKQEKKSGVRPKDQETKTVRVGYKTGEHDLRFKAGKIDEFLLEGHGVKVELTLRGREKALAHLGKEKMLNFLKMIVEPFIAQDVPKRSPYGWVMMIRRDKKVPIKTKTPKKSENVPQHEDKKGPVQASEDNSGQKNDEAPAGPESL